jgi:hypothetical protein
MSGKRADIIGFVNQAGEIESGDNGKRPKFGVALVSFTACRALEPNSANSAKYVEYGPMLRT